MLLVVYCYLRPTVSIAWQCVFHKRGDFIGSTHRTLCFHQHASWLIILDQTSCRSRTSTSRQLHQWWLCRRLSQTLGRLVHVHYWSPLRQSIRQQRQASASRVSPPSPTRNGLHWFDRKHAREKDKSSKSLASRGGDISRVRSCMSVCPTTTFEVLVFGKSVDRRRALSDIMLCDTR